MYCVYWIRRDGHTKYLTEGYIGITSNLPERLKAHKKNKRKTPFSSAIKKYGWENLSVEILHDNLSLQEALSIESRLRPTSSIGWNCQRGGELGVESSWYDKEENRNKHREATSRATKVAIALKDTKKARAQRARDNWKNKRDSYKNVSKGSNNPRAILTEEQVRCIKSQLDNKSNRDLADEFNVRIHVIQQIRSGKNWSHI